MSLKILKFRIQVPEKCWFGLPPVEPAIAIGYSQTEVKCDLNVWPTFEIYLVRGVDDYQHNPVGKVPSGNGCPMRMLPGSWEFP